jgi:divalent metal cation (Fe/Co/Zn/Cd) transporter
MAIEADKTAVLGVLAIAVFQMGQEYRESAPKAADLRSDANTAAMKQHLVDAELHTGIIVAGVALAAWWLTDSLAVPAIIVGTFAGLVAYHHSLLEAPAVPDYRG